MDKVYTIDRLVSEAMALMGEESKYKSDYMNFAGGVTNTLLADCFVINNTIRESAGLPALEEIPLVEGTEEIPYEYECIKNIMVYGMAFYFTFQDEDNDKANLFNATYEANKLRFAKAQYEPIEGN